MFSLTTLEWAGLFTAGLLVFTFGGECLVKLYLKMKKWANS